MARLNRWVAGAAAGVLAALAQVSAAAAADGEILHERAPGAIPDSYIVVLADEDASRAQTRATINELSDEYDATVEQRYENSVRGFAATMSREEALELSEDPAVEFVQQNRVIEAFATQTNAPWGLDRIDQRNLPLDSSFTFPNTASNVTAYIIDTGILTTHSQFGGRATWGTNTIDATNTDCNGHGTHVAGTVGGGTFGVAKGVRLKAVKVLNCNGNGTTASVVQGIDWVTADHAAGQPAVANMSLGAPGSDLAIENAVRNSIADGVVYAIAAGNSNTSACNFTPARVAEAITVGATATNDARASFSNYGTCADIFAPGVAITSAWYTSNTATYTADGTSMAAPHVAGAAALVLGANPTLTPAQVANALINNATTNKVTNAGTGSPNRLLYVAGAAEPTPTPTPSPTPSPTPTPTPAPGCVQTNGTDVAIPDNGTVESAITIAGCPGNVATAKVEVHIKHTYRGDLVVRLIAPNGSSYVLANRSGGSADNIDETFAVNVTTQPANGTWKLQVQDAAMLDTGYIDSWSLDLQAPVTTCPPVTNGTDVAIPDNGWAESAITIAGCNGNASAAATVEVHIKHTYRGDLVVSLIAPDGQSYVLANRSGGSADNIDQTFIVNLSNKPANGTWKLRVQDAATLDTGSIDSWTLSV